MKDLLIVGFGLAGLSVASQAHFKHKDFDILSNQSQLSSKIAGGIINPVAVKRMKPVWQVETFLPFALKFYKNLDKKFDIKSFQNQNIKVFIHDVEQENNWYEAKDKTRLTPYLSSKVKVNTKKSIQASKIGEIKAGLVDLKTLIHSAKQYFESENSWIPHTFKHSKLKIHPNKVSYNNQDYKHIVFCEGFGVTQNPYFKNLGIYGNKGDYLIFKSKELQLENIAKAKYFLIPLGEDMYKFGATYQREPLDHKPSEKAKNQLLDALNKMIDAPYEIIDQVCGIRPTTRDRRPILGAHQQHKNLHIINGFGSRGVLISPLLGKYLIDNIFEQKPIPNDVFIGRLYAQI